MTRDEVIDLLTVITGFDRRFANRPPSQTDVDMWQATVGDLDLTDATTAVVGHFRDSDAWLLPVHIRRRVAAIRGERLDRAKLGPPTEDPEVLNDPVRYLAAVRQQIADAASPAADRRAIGGAE